MVSPTKGKVMQVSNLSNAAELSGHSDSPTPEAYAAWMAYIQQQKKKYPNLY
jgi:hypothetical protein